jgi:hypothetical protein
MRFLKNGIAVIVLAALSVHAAAQDPASWVGGPILGFVQDDQGGKIWPLLGVSGASIMGRHLDLSSGIARAAISPTQAYAIAIRMEDAQPVLVSLNSANPDIVPLAGSRPGAERIAISPSGTAAGLYISESKVLQVFSGLPTAPAIVYEFDMSVLTGDVTMLAVSDDAALVLANVRDSENNGTWAISGSDSAWPVNAGQPSAMIFLANRHDAVIADDAAREVFLLQTSDRDSVRLPGMIFPEDSPPFAAVALSSEAGMIFVAHRGSENITVVDLTTGKPANLACWCNPTGFFPLKGSSVFRLNGVSGGPMMVLDASSGEARVVLIPPGREELDSSTTEQQ